MDYSLVSWMVLTIILGEELGLFSVLGIETQIWIGHNPSCIDLGTFHFYRHGGF